MVGAVLGTISVYQVLTSSYGVEFGGFGRIKIAYIAGDYWEPRISGPLADPNFYAQTLIILVPIALLRILDESSLKLKIISAYSLLVLTLAIIYTYSRGGILALGLVVALSVINTRIKFKYLLILLFIFTPLLIFIPSQFKSRLGTLEEFISNDDESKIHLDSSFQQRVLYMKTAWAMFSDNPILGVGSGNYSEYYDKYSEQVGSVVSSYENFGQRRFPHNLYLQVASETGLVGLTIFMAIISLTIKYYYSAYKKFRDVKNINQRT
jgi:O-antigen ligase